MAWAWDGSTSKLSAPITQITGAWTWIGWTRSFDLGTDTGGLAVYFINEQSGTPGNWDQSLYVNSSSGDLLVLQGRSIGVNQAISSTVYGSLTTADWLMMCARFDNIGTPTSASIRLATLSIPPFDPAQSQAGGSGVVDTTAGNFAVLGNKSTSDRTLNGYLEDVILDTRFWSDAEVDAYWQGRRPRSAAGLVYWLPLQEDVVSPTQVPVDWGPNALTWTAVGMVDGPARPPIQRRYSQASADLRPAPFTPAGATHPRKRIR